MRLSPRTTVQGFNGSVKGVPLAIDVAVESFDRLVSPEAAIRIAMARQIEFGMVMGPDDAAVPITKPACQSGF